MAKQQIITPAAKIEKLDPFEGMPVIATGIEMPGAGGGLHDALAVDPQEWTYGETVFVVVETLVRKIRHEPVQNTEAWRRVHVLSIENATIVEGEAVEAYLADQKDRIQRAREESAGVRRLPTDEELFREHELGEHAGGLVVGCVECDKEQEAADAETDEGK